MSSASQYHNLLRKAPWASLLLVAVCSLALGYAYLRLPPLSLISKDEERARSWPEHHDVIVSDWTVLQGEAGSPVAKGSLADRFRFAGAFFVSGGGRPDMRKAVLDEIKGGVQHIVSEGDLIDDVTVIGVYRDRLVLRANGIEEELWLSFSMSDSSMLTEKGGSHTGAVEEAGDTCRFGTQVGENNWLFKRDALMAYYDELMDEPERLLQVFDSLKDLRDERGKITGYHLDIEGERQFFDDIGFREGDVVRKVNAMPMTSRRRAEFFIKQFVDDRLSVILIDIERDGKLHRQVYRVR